MDENEIPAHRHQVTHRSAEPRFVEGGNDDRPGSSGTAKAKRVRKPKAAKPAPVAADETPVVSDAGE